MEVRTPVAEESTLAIHSPSRRGPHIGARAEVRIVHDSGFHQTYAFSTHGMTSDAVVDRVAEIEAYHEAKTARLLSMRSLHGHEFTVESKGFRIVDCAIFDKGVTLYVDVRDISQEPAQQVAGFPMRVSYRALGAVPDEAAILAAVVAKIPPTENLEAANAAFVAKVTAKRGG